MNSKDQSFLNKKTKIPSSNSSKSQKSDGSEDFAFSNKSNSAYTIRHCSDYSKFKEYLNQIKSPSYTTDIDFLKRSGIIEAVQDKNNLDKEIKYSIPIENIDKSKIFPISIGRHFFQNNNKSKTGNFIFSNLFEDEEKKEEKIFQNIHNYGNGYFQSSKLSEFCPDFKSHFENNNIDEFYGIKKEEFFIRSMKAFHYHEYGIGHFYSPKGTGKSILFRSILVNFINYKDDPRRYTPLMFFNMKLLNDLINKSDALQIKKILLHESYSLFRERKTATNFIEKININQNDIMKMIQEIIKIALTEIKEKQKVFILDGYSVEYDSLNILNDITQYVLEKKNFFLEIIYDIKNSKDAEMLYKNISPKNHINYNTDEANKYFYFERLKLFSEIKTNFPDNEIPEKYCEIFGDNASYFFEYKKIQNKMTFEDFVKAKKGEIKEEILYFCNGKCKYYLNEIKRLIETQEKFLYDEIIKYIPSNYIEINIEPKPNPRHYGEDFHREILPKYYSLNFSFPLIKDIIKEIIMGHSFIDMKNPEFLKLPGGALGTNFDIEMNKIIRRLMEEEKFFEHKRKIHICVENILEKKEKQSSENQYTNMIFKVNKIFFQEKEKYNKINFKDMTCIGVFQNEFCGKAFDILFLTRKNEDNLFNMNLIQVKCSDTYKENIEEIKSQVPYVKDKFSYLLNIQVNNIFLSYLSIYQKPKKFANSNKDRSFLYNIMTDKFVNFNNEEYTEFPILEDSIIYLDEESNIINSIVDMLCTSYHKCIKLIKKEKKYHNFNSKSIDEIKNILCNNELYVYISPPEFNYYFKIDNFFGSFIKTEPIVYEGVYENVFEIQY